MLDGPGVTLVGADLGALTGFERRCGNGRSCMQGGKDDRVMHDAKLSEDLLERETLG